MEKQRNINDKESTLLNTLIAEFGSLSELRGLALDSSPKLIAYLLESSAEFSAFFSKVGEVVVFEREKFLEFLRLRVLDKSYTAFSNKIGLRLERQELQGVQRVVLDFPYKDCVLKGGASSK